MSSIPKRKFEPLFFKNDFQWYRSYHTHPLLSRYGCLVRQARKKTSTLVCSGKRKPLLQGSISLTFHKQLLHVHIPKAQKKHSSHQCLFLLLGTECGKAALRMLMKLTPGVDLANVSQTAFTCADHKSAQKTFKSPVSFSAFGN